jgi:hypothetical protein
MIGDANTPKKDPNKSTTMKENLDFNEESIHDDTSPSM